MANEVNIYTPRYLAEVVRQAPPVHTFFRDTFFTNVKKSTTERVDIDLVKGDRRMAAFVHPRVGGKVLKASGYKTESYKPPLVNPCDITTADRYMTRMPGEDLYSGETPAQRSAQQLMEEYSRLNDATTRREEWMAVQAIVTGQVPVVGEGVNEIIDFGFTNTETLTGTAQWGKSAAKISDNLEDWADKVLTNGFANVDMAIMGKTALRNFLADEKISKMLDNRRVEMGLIHPRDLPNGVKYVGHLNSPNIDIYTYAEVYLDDWTDPAAPKAILESGWGTSELATKANALFGIKADARWSGKAYSKDTKECYDGVTYTTITALFRAYDSWAESVADHSAFLLANKRYAAVVGERDYKAACKAIKAAGYATDPGYPQKLIGLIEKYGLTVYDGKAEQEDKTSMNISITKKTSTHNTTAAAGRAIRYIVVHYTAGVTSKPGSAAGTASYFGGTSKQVSADFIVDDGGAVQYKEKA